MPRPFAVTELDHVVLRCRDQARMIHFYTDVLGCPEERRLDFLGLVQLRAGASLVDLVPAEEGATVTAPNQDHFCLGIATTDIAAVAAYLESQQIEVIGEPMERYGARGTGLSIYCRDPEGNVVELKCMPEAVTA